MIFTLLILAIDGFVSPVLGTSYLPIKYRSYCALEGVSEEEWDHFFRIIDCGPIKSCEPTMLETLPTIGKYLG